MGSMEPLFWRAAFENTMQKRTTYTTLTLELRTSASTVAITGQIDICIKVPWVTHGKELCKPYLELLMGRNYAKHATSYSWGGIMQHVFCINPSICTLSSWEGFMQKSKRVNACSFPCNWLWISSLCTTQYEGVSPIIIVYCFCINPSLV